MGGSPWPWQQGISSFPSLFIFLSCLGDQIVLGTKQRWEEEGLSVSAWATALMSPWLNPGWEAVGLLVELAFSALRGIVWFGACFHFTTKMSGFSPPNPLLNKGGPFGFHKSDHLSPSWNGHLGSRAQRLPLLPQRGPCLVWGPMPASCSLCQC